MRVDGKYVCGGCGRPELHKMCPAWGTSYYGSGKLFTKEAEEATKDERAASLERQQQYIAECLAKGIDPSGLS